MKIDESTTPVVHRSEPPHFSITASASDATRGAHLLCFSGTLCTTTVPGAGVAIGEWLEGARPQSIEIDLGDVEFMDGRGVSLLVSLQTHAETLGIAWSVLRMSDRAREILGMCDLLEPMGFAAASAVEASPSRSSPER